MSFALENQKISASSPTYVIAEAGVNHNGNLNLAKKLCDTAKDCGANAIKFQTWNTDEIILEHVSKAKYQINKQNDESQFEMLKNLEMPLKNFKELYDYCKKIGITFLSTPNDLDSFKFLEALGISAFKIGSDDLDNFQLLKNISYSNKPMIISTGMNNLDSIKKTMDFLHDTQQNLIFLHCTTSYPTQIQDCNLNAMITMEKELNTIVGYSDHTQELWIPVIAIYKGAKIIEKHFTLDKTFQGPDHKMSLEPDELKEMIKLIRKFEDFKKINKNISVSELSNFLKVEKEKITLACGSYIKKPTKSELLIANSIKKTIVSKCSIKKGEHLTTSNISIKRAGFIGMSPNKYYEILNHKVAVDIEKNEVLQNEKIE